MKRKQIRRIDANKVYAFIGRATTILTGWALGVCACYNLAIYILDNCITVYR